MTSRTVRLAAIALIALAAAGGDLALTDAGLLHAALVGALCLAAAAATARLVPRPELALLGAALPAVWSLVYAAEPIVLAAAVLAALPALGSPRQRWVSALLAGAFAAGLVVLSTAPMSTAAIAGALGVLGGLLRPRLPTRQQLVFLRSASLFGPGLLLLGLMAANAATGQAEALSVRQTVLTALGLAGLASLLGLTGLGQTTVLESDDPAQRHVWLSLAATLAVPLALIVRGNPTSVLQVMPVASVPMGVASAVTVARLDAENGLPIALGASIVFVTVVAQFAL